MLVLVVAAVVFTVLRFRSREVGLPRGRDKNTPAEAAYAGLIACIVALLVYLTFESMSDLEAAEGPAELEVAVTASRWNWRFEYTHHGVVRQGTRARIPTLVVPVNTPVRFTQTSRDVIHSFWIPELRFKRDAFPGRETAFTLRFPDEGFLRQAGQCAEFCGLDHASMAFNVEVLPRADFARWLRREAGGS